MNAFHHLHASHNALELIPLQRQDIASSRQDLEDRVTDAIKARDDFIHSRLPSSLTHCGFWLLAGLSATGSVAMTGTSVVWATVVGSEIYDEMAREDISPIQLAFSVAMGTLSLASAMAASGLLAQLAAQAIAQITEDNEAIVQKMEYDIHIACRHLVEASTPVDLERLLQKGEIPLFLLVPACREDADKAALLAQHVLAARQLPLLLELAQHSLAHCSEVGAMLLNTLEEPQVFIELLEQSPDAAEMLAVVCMAPNAMLVSAPDALDNYLLEHPDVAREALVRLKKWVLDFALHELYEQIELRRLAGVAMAVARHAQVLEVLSEPA